MTKAGPHLIALKHRSIEAVRVMAESEADDFRRASLHLAEFLEAQDYLEIVVGNHRDLDKVLAAADAFSSSSSEARRLSAELGIEANRMMLNLLASVRFYLDGTEARLKRQYREDVAIADQFKTLCSAAYDGSFAYRFFYKLRNYAQHIRVPIGRVLLSTDLSGPGRTPRHVLTLALDRDRLLSEGRGLWGTVLADLEACDQSIDILPHAETVVNALTEIRSRLRSVEVPELVNSGKQIESIGQAAIARGATPAVGRPVSAEGRRVTFDLTQAPVSLLRELGFQWATTSFG